MRPRVAAAVVALVLLAAGASGLKHTLKVRGEARTAFFIENFGFLPHGKLVIATSQFSLLYPLDVSIDPARLDDFRVGFLIRRTSADTAEFSSSTDKTCAWDRVKTDDLIVPLFDRRNWTRMTFEHTIAPGEEDLFNIFFINCEPDAEVSFNAFIAAWNPGPDYLSAGKSPLVTAFALFAVAYAIAGLAFARQLRMPNAEIKSVHWLMVAMVVVKVITLIVSSVRLHYMKTTGQGHGWNVVFYIMTFLRGVLLFTVITLVGLGWSSVHSHMVSRDKKILAAVIALQVISSVALIMTSELSPGSPNWITWFDILRVVDIVACGAVLFPIVWSIKHLRDASGADGKAVLAQLKLKLFRESYLAVVAWVYVTRIVVFLLEATVPYKSIWLAESFGEASTLAFYVYAGYAFRPVPSNQFLRLAQNDSDEDEGIVLTEVVTNNNVEA